MKLIILTAMTVCTTVFANVNEWTMIGPEGGNVFSLAVDALRNSIVYAATCGGVFRSDDGAASWRSVNLPPPAGFCRQSQILVVDPHTSGVVYLAGCDGIFKTTDGGASSSRLDESLSRECTAALAIDALSPDTLYASRGSSLYKSIDGGTSWNGTGLQVRCGASALAADPQVSGVLYAGGCGGLYKSIDGAETWSLANSGLPSIVGALAIDPEQPSTLYAGAQGEIFKSTDGGANWRLSSLGFPAGPPQSVNVVLSLVISRQNPAQIDVLIQQLRPQGRPYFYLFARINGGASWSPVTDFPLSLNIPLYTLALDSQNPSRMYVGAASSGVLKTTDGGATWNGANSGLRGMPIGPALVDPGTGALYGFEAGPNGAGILYRSSDEGQSWVGANSLPAWPASLVADPNASGVLYAGGSFGVFKSVDGGVTWFDTQLRNPVGPIAIDPRTPGVVYGGGDGCYGSCDSRVFKTTDDGKTWSVPTVSLKGQGCCSVIAALAVDPQDPNILYAGGSDGNGSGSGLWKSTDGGDSWASLNSALGFYGDIDDIAIGPGTPSAVWAGSAYLFKSTDGGQSWASANSGLPEAFWIAVLGRQAIGHTVRRRL